MKNVNAEYAEIGKRIKEIRLKRNMTQDSFAEEAGICSGQQVSNIERGVCGVSVIKLKDICRVLEIDSDYLLFGITPDNAETELSKYLSQMNEEQLKYVIETVKLYAKSCGIE